MAELFIKLGLAENLVEALRKEGIDTPTGIQEMVIPKALNNKDIIGQSETGTGKTLAYLLPLFQKINCEAREMQAAILVPTHELAIQIQRQIEILSRDSGLTVTSIPVIGNVNIKRQVEKLREKPHIIVGSTGRILELIKIRKISTHTLKTIIIDEADRMLDENNIANVRSVIKSTLKERQIMVFSATIPQKTVDIAAQMMKEPEIIRIQEKESVNLDVSHMYFTSEQRDKIEVLRKLVHSIKPERAIVFINKSDEIEITTAKLKYHGLKAEGIHGTSIKLDRKKALEEFRTGKVNLLVASDIAARGLDIKGVTHIFNLDLPEDPRGYLHRAGRTGRAGEKGVCISIVNDREKVLVDKYQKSLLINITHKVIYKGKIFESRKRDYTKKYETDKSKRINKSKK